MLHLAEFRITSIRGVREKVVFDMEMEEIEFALSGRTERRDLDGASLV